MIGAWKYRYLQLSLRNHGSSLQLLSADDIRSAMLKGADKLALQNDGASKETLKSYNGVDLSIRQLHV